IIFSFSDALNITKDNYAVNSDSRSSNWQNNALGDRDFYQEDVYGGKVDEEVSYVNKSSSMAVVEASTMRVLIEQNKDVRLEMASTTKIMTALVAIENNDLDKEFTIPDEAVGVEGSSIYLKSKEIWTIRDLLYGLMLRSGNDAATALAIATSGSVENFVGLMNDKVSDLGLENTHFENPHGLHADNHYTSAYDLAIISAVAMQNPIFKEIAGCKMYTVQANSSHPTYYFANKNKMLGIYDGANGIKTGYTKDSGRCLVTAAERDGMQLIGVVLNVYDHYNASAINFDKAFANYSPVTIGKSGDILQTLNIEEKNYNIALQNDLVLPLKEGEIVGIECYFEINEGLQAPLNANSIIGKMQFYNDNRLLFSANIVNMEEIDDIGALRKLSAYSGEMRVSVENGEIKQIFSLDRSGVTAWSGQTY
ncbi:MAG: D-alanyl-D-alanine carboxypeptidase, partial [Clostridia bacterium]|nr:D-alanyl-D-alanine carboxypeptidase [Clostridia bacterium]